MHILELVYPGRCPFCDRVTEQEICEECKKELKTIKEPRCKKCGKPVRYREQEYCGDCQIKHHEFEQGRSLWLHKQPVSTSIYRFKYGNRRRYAKYYGSCMAREFGTLLKQWHIEVIMPIPLHKARHRKRGYNQAELLATEIGLLTDIPVDTVSLLRGKKTKPQKQLTEKARAQNMKDAFRLSNRLQRKKTVLLVDDIYTTGCTIDVAAKLLKCSGVEKVYFLTISIGQGF
ncbi:MAG: ComF family protein [Lachnospiraceae bacterium]